MNENGKIANEIYAKYTAGTLTAEKANVELAKCGFPTLAPGKNILTAADIAATKVGATPAEANGYGLLDSGTGSMEKVHVVNGKLVNCDMGESYALVLIGGKVYHVKGAALTV